MIRPNCNYCGNELNDFGAILLSPPNLSMVKKYHICINCYELIKPKDIESTEPHLPFADVIKSVCDECRFKAECRYKEMNTEQNCKYFIDEQTVL